MLKSTGKSALVFPYCSVLAALLLCSYFFMAIRSDLQAFYQFPARLFASPYPEALLAVFLVLVLFESRWMLSRFRIHRRRVEQLSEQVRELLDYKKQLNAKAHIYAGHADKLKLFISDKLLEYIEYDEKFLHFKSIASEVRHNGVISYDKVTTALNELIESATDNRQLEELIEARESLQYLWDLLDLSTADNIALHIANQVCESEEQLFQSELGNSEAEGIEQPVFAPQSALIKALGRCFGQAPVLVDNGGMQVPDQPQVWIRCQDTAPILGNENHIILALENLIHNAQFFAGRSSGRRRDKSARIAIDVLQRENFVQFSVYNGGQPIDDQVGSQLFQLGYSTRRVREHHGKGLGLYFVNEIVKGYEGNVSFENIANRADVLSLRLEMQTGEVITDVIEFLAVDAEMQCRKSGEDSASQCLQWDFYGALQSVEMTHQSDQQTHRLAHIPESVTIFDPSSERFPRWQLDIDQASSHATRISFTPLSVQGVEFTLLLPTLTARLEGDLLSIDEADMEQQVANLSHSFRPLEEQ